MTTMMMAPVMIDATLTAEPWWYGMANPREMRSGARRPQCEVGAPLRTRGLIGLSGNKPDLAVRRVTYSLCRLSDSRTRHADLDGGRGDLYANLLDRSP